MHKALFEAEEGEDLLLHFAIAEKMEERMNVGGMLDCSKWPELSRASTACWFNRFASWTMMTFPISG